MLNVTHSELKSVSYSLDDFSFSFPYPCESYSICSPYELLFYPGRYFLEIWGASGGNIDYGQKHAEGGKGGYSSGVFTVIRGTKTLYLFLGGHKDQNADAGDEIADPTYNGGGSVTHKYDSPGGGASDFRLKKGNDWDGNLDSRILVAGGGGGGWVNNNANLDYKICYGGNGGGENGNPGDGYHCQSQYGTQTGSSISKCDSDITRYPESDGRGGSGWGSGGGGYHAGGSVQNGAGGGGSGFVDLNYIKTFGSYKAQTLQDEHTGAGTAKITIISLVNCSIKLKTRIVFPTVLILVIIFMK